MKFREYDRNSVGFKAVSIQITNPVPRFKMKGDESKRRPFRTGGSPERQDASGRKLISFRGKGNLT